jgi:hypothetical protein
MVSLVKNSGSTTLLHYLFFPCYLSLLIVERFFVPAKIFL